MASGIYGKIIETHWTRGLLDWAAAGGDPATVSLLDDGYTPNYETEVVMTTAGGSRVQKTGPVDTVDIALTEVDPLLDTGNNKIHLDSSLTTLTFLDCIALPQNARSGITQMQPGADTDGARIPIVNGEFSGGDITCNGSDIDVVLHADGVLSFSYP